MTIKNNPADDVISIIVPCFNEESVLPAFYSAVSDAASSIEGAVCEFLFIDDGSSDRTALFSPICENKERFEKRCDQMNYHLMKPSSIELLKKQYALAGIEKVFLLPSDCSFETGEPDISNDEIEKIVQCDPTFFVGFASADPRKESAAEELEKAFKFQNLAGLYINTARLHMYPCDERLFVLYDICKKYKRPIIFQAGLSMENNSLAKYCRPIEFEEVLSKYPEVNICLSHVGWPWVQETAALLLKYENCYTNTALMNFDGPYQIYKKVFTEDMGALWVEHNIADKIMFGSGSPRIRPVRSKRGLDSLGFSEETLEKIYAENAERFLGRE